MGRLGVWCGGLCQIGAAVMSEQGYSYKEILQALLYYGLLSILFLLLHFCILLSTKNMPGKKHSYTERKTYTRVPL